MNPKNYHIAIIGPENVIGNFKALGLETFPINQTTEALETIKQLKKTTAEGSNKYAVIFIIDSLLKNLNEEEKNKISGGSLPAILTIPALGSDSKAGLEKLKRLTERAIGSDISNI